jgi:hypothetical protein
MYYTTGFTNAGITELCTRIEAHGFSPSMRKWPPVLGLRGALKVTLTYLRRNRVQAEIAETFGVSQPTISRAISAITPMLMTVLLEYVPTADELDARGCYVVDGTLLPCWSWAANPELYSGKHKTTGAPRGALLISPAKRAETGGGVFGSNGLPVARKGCWENSMLGNRWPCQGVRNGAPGDPRDKAKADTA